MVTKFLVRGNLSSPRGRPRQVQARAGQAAPVHFNDAADSSDSDQIREALEKELGTIFRDPKLIPRQCSMASTNVAFRLAPCMGCEPADATVRSQAPPELPIGPQEPNPAKPVRLKGRVLRLSTEELVRLAPPSAALMHLEADDLAAAEVQD
jgi:hypothetical protein